MITSNETPCGTADLPVSEIVIEAGKSEMHYWRDLWDYRELFYFLAWRDILVRYKQTVIGIAWAVVQPLMMTFVYVIIFQYFAKMKSEGSAPYAVMVLAALLPWQFFSRALTEASNSLVTNANLVSKIYFPRLIVPAASVITALIDFLICAALLALVMAWYHFVPGWRVVTLPLYLLLALGASAGTGLWFAALNVSYRDFRYIVPFALMIGGYVSPVAYSSGIVPEKWRLLYSLNPLVGVIDGFRWAIIGGDTKLFMPGLLVAVLLVALTLFTGIRYFRKTERKFADVI